MQNGALYQLPILVQTISEKEFGLEPNNETFFHTPNTTGMDDGSNSRKALKKRLQWPTPTTMDTITRSKESYLKVQNRPRQGKNLTKLGDIIYWPTPMSTEHKGNRQTRANHQNGLTQAVLATETGGQLNPTWVEYLMGWPLGFTDLKPLVMDKSLYVQQLHGSYLNE
jgi:DNA (cytosine-5)-methyltransferase 1